MKKVAFLLLLLTSCQEPVIFSEQETRIFVDSSTRQQYVCGRFSSNIWKCKPLSQRGHKL